MEHIEKRKLSISLYLNYLVHGIGLIILTQNMQELEKFWHSPLATVSYVISGIGIGKLIAYSLFGYLSDRIGRKTIIMVGMASYTGFFIGIPLTKSIIVAFLFAVLAGIANSALDSGTYPTFVEMGGSSSASNVFIKAFMSMGEFILPLIVATLETRNLWFGWSFVLPLILLVINFLLIRKIHFPTMKQAEESEEQAVTISKPRKVISAIALSLYGFTSMAIMILFTQWITIFAHQKLHLLMVTSHGLLSLYSIGSIMGVVVTFIILKMGVAEAKVLLTNTAISLVAILSISVLTNQLLITIACWAFGFTAAGGVLQVALNMLLKVLPVQKGVITGLYMTFGSIATFTVPVVTGWLANNIQMIMNLDVFIGIFVTGLALVAALCAQKVPAANPKLVMDHVSSAKIK
ncbi:MFS transporter [Lentilactobacillus sp. Marseille-Q4993]|uniref:MFS transporter n=1 Tax=Lentilactobacillus sp. Marseille-Q4993 TaxID=3039492 RepID=UPI0024BC43D8|nr:MFS transporter [Lentilactobacillus sp. Marseille-Q4993]